MIDVALKLLRGLALLPLSPDPPVVVNFSHDTTLQILDDSGACLYSVKLSRRSLRREFEAQLLAFEHLPDLVAQPLAHHREDGFDIVVSEGVPHRRLEPQDLPARHAEIEDALLAYLKMARTHFAVAGREPHRDGLRAVAQSLAGTRCGRDALRWIDGEGAALLDRLPHVRQHGDLGLTNIGLRDPGIVIFDWEDFGRIELPGFDAFLFLGASCDFRPDVLDRLLTERYDGPFRRLNRHAAELYGIGPDEARHLARAYLLLFHDLKASRFYTPAIVRRTRHLLDSLPDLVPAPPAPEPGPGDLVLTSQGPWPRRGTEAGFTKGGHKG